jgi:hypothetical protein
VGGGGGGGAPPAPCVWVRAGALVRLSVGSWLDVLAQVIRHRWRRRAGCVLSSCTSLRKCCMSSMRAEAAGGPSTSCTWWPRGGVGGGMKLPGPRSEGPVPACSDALRADARPGGGGGGGRRVGVCGGGDGSGTNLPAGKRVEWPVCSNARRASSSLCSRSSRRRYRRQQHTTATTTAIATTTATTPPATARGGGREPLRVGARWCTGRWAGGSTS